MYHQSSFRYQEVFGRSILYLLSTGRRRTDYKQKCILYCNIAVVGDLFRSLALLHSLFDTAQVVWIDQSTIVVSFSSPFFGLMHYTKAQVLLFCMNLCSVLAFFGSFAKHTSQKPGLKYNLLHNFLIVSINLHRGFSIFWFRAF